MTMPQLQVPARGAIALYDQLKRPETDLRVEGRVVYKRLLITVDLISTVRSASDLLEEVVAYLHQTAKELNLEAPAIDAYQAPLHHGWFIELANMPRN